MFLGVDQSLNGTGVCVLPDEGNTPLYLNVLNPGKWRGVERLAFIWDSIDDVVSKYSPFQAMMEGYAYGTGVGRVFELGEVGGIVKLCLHRRIVPLQIVTPSALKKFVTANGGADKEKMMKATLLKWKQDITNDNACDAYGLAQVARAWHKGTSVLRNELEVLKVLRDEEKVGQAVAKSRVKLTL